MSKLVTVNEASAKLKFLALDRTASERGGYEPNWSGFAKRIAELRVERRLDEHASKNYRNTLESSGKNNKIDSDTELIVAEICRFNVSSPNWRSGTLAEFKTEYNGTQFRVTRLPEWSINAAISVTLMFSENRAAASWPFDVDVVCQKAMIDVVGQSIAVSRATLQITWDTNQFSGTSASRPDERHKRLDAIQEDLAGR